VLQCVAVCCSVLQCAAILYWSMRQTKSWCGVLQCVAVCCAECCRVLQPLRSKLREQENEKERLQYVAVYGIVLQCIATCCGYSAASCFSRKLTKSSVAAALLLGVCPSSLCVCMCVVRVCVCARARARVYTRIFIFMFAC